MGKPTEAVREQVEVEAPKFFIRASISPGSVDTEKRTAEMVWSTGAKVLRHPFFDEPFYEELSLDARHVDLSRLNNGAPLLAAHRSFDLGSVIGVVESATVDGKEGRATVRFSDREEVEPIFRDVQSGILRNVSVGYRVYKFEDVSERDDKIKTLRAVDWEPLELSVVPIGADDGAGFRSDDDENNPCTIIMRAVGAGNDNHVGESDMKGNSDQKQNRAAEEGTAANQSEQVQNEQQRSVDEGRIREEATKAERKRMADIRTAVRAAKLDDDFAQKLIDDGVNIDQARAAIINKWADGGDQPEIRGTVQAVPGADERDKVREAMTSAILARMGAEKHDGQNPWRGYRLHELARACLESAGVNVRGQTPEEFARTALSFQVRAAGQTTSDFPVILENTLHRMVLAGFEAQPHTWERFCRTGDVSDFRVWNRLVPGLIGNLDTVNEAGEYLNKNLPDAEKNTNQVVRRGNIINITPEIIVNDDIGYIQNLADGLGRIGNRSIERSVYSLLNSNPTLSDGVALFHASHNNLAGSGAVPSVDTLDAARQAMAQQTAPGDDAEYLDIRPNVAVCTLAQGGNMRVLVEAVYDPDAANKLQKPNKVNGIVSDVVDSPRVSGTAWYLFADPMVAPVLEVVFLNGQRQPRVMMEENFRTAGLAWRVELPYGVGAIDFRGGYKNAGA